MKSKILKKLKRGEFVSGQRIADELNISRTAVFKHIKALQREGFVIESVRRQGYRLVEESKKLHPLVLDKYLKTKFIGRPTLHFDLVASTINQVMLRAEKADEGLVVVAEKQLKGRGRFQRHWESPAGGIWASILLKPKCPPAEAARMNIIASLAIAVSIEEVAKIEARIKWPNDVLVGENNHSPLQKVAGILTEMVAELDKINYAILSFGVNVNNPLPAELQGMAITLKQATSRQIDRPLLFAAILNKIEDYYIDWQTKGFDSILKSWRQYCSTLGRNVEVINVGVERAVPLQGKALDVDENGRLVLQSSDGKKHYLSAGEVSVLPDTDEA